MTKDRRPRRCRPSLERLEVRDLPSASAVHATTSRHVRAPNLNLIVASETAAYTGHLREPLERHFRKIHKHAGLGE